jgi:hypothetical protein
VTADFPGGPAGEPGLGSVPGPAPDPGLDQLISVLGSAGTEAELGGRDQALAMFRAARSRAGRSRVGRPHAGRSRVGRSRMGRPLSARFRLHVSGLSAAMAAILLAVGGTTAAAYAAALPAPVQRIVHNVLAPLGVPNSRASSAALPTGVQPSATGDTASAGVPGTVIPERLPGATPRGTASAPGGTGKRNRGGADTKTTANNETLTLGVAHTDVTAGDDDTFTAQVTTAGGRGKARISVRLLERRAGATAWLTAAAGTTNARGDVTLTATRLTVNAAFELRTAFEPGTARAAVTTRQISVTVIPGVTLRLSGTQLAVTAWPAEPGNTAVLQRLYGEAWTDVTSERLGADRKAMFAAIAGDAYRVLLEASAAHGNAISNQVNCPDSDPGSSPSATETASSEATPQ